MKRDMDLIRDLLIGIEADPNLDGTQFLSPDNQDNLGVIGIGRFSNEEIAYHLKMLIEAGLVDGKVGFQGMPLINKMTWQGHEFLDNIRDAGIWGKTKERLRGLPSVAVGVMTQIATAEVKKHLGLP
jgi:hypothetical protein